jgi:DNA primase
VDKPPLAAVLDHYGIQYSYKEGWQRILCCFHDESTPSLSVNLSESAYKCFACPAQGGDVFDFVMEKEHVEFPEAKAFVSEWTGQEYESRAKGTAGHRPGRRGGFRPRFGKKVEV